jgi:hypothetical protein
MIPRSTRNAKRPGQTAGALVVGDSELAIDAPV